MGEGYKETAIKLLMTCVLLLIVGGGLVLMYPHYRRAEALKQENEELQRKVDCKKREIALLQEYQSRYQNDTDFVERIARMSSRVFPGELVFIFEKD